MEEIKPLVKKAYGLHITVDDAFREVVRSVIDCNAEEKAEVMIVIDGHQYPMTLDEFVHRLT